MNERGFFTIIGLCLLLIAAISIKGVNEFETNYSRGVTNFQIEHHLQNLAESYLIDNIDSIENLPQKINLGNISYGELILKNVAVEIYGKNIYIHMKNGDYTNFENLPEDMPGKLILSVASCDSPFIGGKMYRRALAYVLDDDPETENIDESETVHFMNDL